MMKKLFLLIIILLFLFPSLSSSSESHKFLLSMYHYNIQYVAGDKKAEDKIITESFLPIVEMYLRHPEWGADIEMQGYMLEVMKERYPEILEKFRILVNRGQVNLVCFYYSDQLFLAFPLTDMEWSEKINSQIFKECGITRSDVVFTQEGQFGEGMIPFMKKYNYKTALIARKLYKYFYKNDEILPYYEKDGVYIVVGDDINYKNGFIQVNWSKLGDKESLLSQENSIIKKEEEGFKVVKISDYIEKLKELNIKSQKLKPILDCTGKPQDSENFFLRSLNYKIRQELLASETLLNNAKNINIDTKEEEEKLIKAWKHQLLSEVSDSTGWFPSATEIQYSFEEANRAKELAEEIIENLKKKLNLKKVAINTKTDKIIPVIGVLEGPASSLIPEVKCPYPIKIVSDGVDYKITTYSFIKNRYDIKIDFINKNSSPAKAKVLFKRKTKEIIYSPALLEDKVVKYPLNLFSFDYTYLPLSNGLIGLDKKVFLIKHNAFNHIPCRIDKRSKYIEFELYNIPPGNTTCQFTIAYADGDASLNLANSINTYPTLTK